MIQNEWTFPEFTEAPETEPDRQYYFMEQVQKLVARRSQELGRPLKVYSLVVGCQMNARDSENIM